MIITVTSRAQECLHICLTFVMIIAWVLVLMAFPAYLMMPKNDMLVSGMICPYADSDARLGKNIKAEWKCFPIDECTAVYSEFPLNKEEWLKFVSCDTNWIIYSLIGLTSIALLIALSITIPLICVWLQKRTGQSEWDL